MHCGRPVSIDITEPHAGLLKGEQLSLFLFISYFKIEAVDFFCAQDNKLPLHRSRLIGKLSYRHLRLVNINMSC